MAIFLVTPSGITQEKEGNLPEDSSKDSSGIDVEGSVENSLTVSDFFKDKTDIPDPLSLRDPFKPQGFKERALRKIIKGVIRNGVFTNSPSLQDIEVRSIVINGIYLGENRRAIASVGGSTIILKEG